MNTVNKAITTLRTPTAKFVMKVGLVGGAGYYLHEQGVWKDSNETTKLYGKMYGNVKPYLQEAKKKIPVEIPPLPSTDRVSFLVKNYWNKGVSASFVFLSELPRNVNRWTRNGIEAVKGNAEMKKFVNSFSGTVQTTEQQKK